MFLKFLLIRTRVMLLASIALLGGALAPTAVLAGQFAYLVTEGGGISVFDVDPLSVNYNTEVADIPGGLFPTAGANLSRYQIAMTPDGTRAYFTRGLLETSASNPDDVVVLDLATLTVGAPIIVGDNPEDIAITPDGTRAYVANRGRTGIFTLIGTTVSVIDVDPSSPNYNMVVDTINIAVSVGLDPAAPHIRGPSSVAITPNGDYAYVTTGMLDSPGTTAVQVIDLDPLSVDYNTVIKTIRPSGTSFARNVAFSSDDDAYVIYWGSFGGGWPGRVYRFDAANHEVAGDPSSAWFSNKSFGSIEITPDGTRAYVAGGSTVGAFALDPLPHTADPLGSGPWANLDDPYEPISLGTGGVGEIAITPDGTRAYVVSRNFACGGTVDNGCLFVIDLATNTKVASLRVTGRPRGIAFSNIGPTSNEPPTAVAGDDQSIRAGDTVNLDGSASFDDNTASAALTYAWSFSSLPGGSTATLSGADTATPSFVADVAGTYTLELVVTDEGSLASDPDFVDISSDNLAPTAAAGDDQLVIVGTAVVLDGSGSSDPEMDALTFDWSIASAPVGSTATISNPDMALAGLTPDLEGVYEATLSVSDFIGPGTPDTAAITAATAEGFAEIQIVSANDVVASLTASQVTTGGNQEAFTNFLSQAIGALMQDPPNVAKAIDKLEKALLRTDGCTLRGSPDVSGPEKRDWITDCDAQNEIYGLLSAALDALVP